MEPDERGRVTVWFSNTTCRREARLACVLVADQQRRQMPLRPVGAGDIGHPVIDVNLLHIDASPRDESSGQRQTPRLVLEPPPYCRAICQVLALGAR